MDLTVCMVLGSGVLLKVCCRISHIQANAKLLMLGKKQMYSDDLGLG